MLRALNEESDILSRSFDHNPLHSGLMRELLGESEDITAIGPPQAHHASLNFKSNRSETLADSPKPIHTLN
jgi:hypothetical protein